MSELKFTTNLHCDSCLSKLRPHLDGDAAIQNWSVDLNNPQKVLTVHGVGLSAERIRNHVAEAGFKVLGELDSEEKQSLPTSNGNVSVKPHQPSAANATESKKKTFVATYWPVLLLSAYLVGITALVEFIVGKFDLMRAMANFMGGFFIAFSFFKLLDLPGFADSFQSYDLVARPIRAYAFAYPFIELLLGIAYAARWAPVLTNAVTLLFMLVGIAGVARALLRKQQIQCACLGTVFNLPMSTVALVEDSLMAVMAAAMLLQLAR